MTPARILLMLALSGATAVAAVDEPGAGRAAEVTYSVPAGWERVERERIIVLTPKGISPDQCSLILTPGETLAAAANFNKWFKDKWDALRQGAKVVQGGERTGQDGPQGSSVLYQAALLETVVDGKLARTGLLLYAVHIGDAVHWVVFKTDGAKLFNQHKKTVNVFLAGLRFAETAADKARCTPARPGRPKATPPRAASGSRS